VCAELGRRGSGWGSSETQWGVWTCGVGTDDVGGAGADVRPVTQHGLISVCSLAMVLSLYNVKMTVCKNEERREMCRDVDYCRVY
jgi:hypothetical protein